MWNVFLMLLNCPIVDEEDADGLILLHVGGGAREHQVRAFSAALITSSVAMASIPMATAARSTVTLWVMDTGYRRCSAPQR